MGSNRKIRRASLAKLRANKQRLPDSSQRVVDQLLRQNGKAAPSPRMTGNGIIVAIRNDLAIARLTVHLRGIPQVWVEYNKIQLDGLIRYLQTARKQMEPAVIEAEVVKPEELN